MAIDWSDAPPDVAARRRRGAAAGVDVKVETDRPNNEVTAGETMNLKLTVTNHGHARRSTACSRWPRARTRCSTTRSSSSASSSRAKRARRRRPPAGATSRGTRSARRADCPRTRRASASIPKDALMRADGVKFHFEEARGPRPGRRRAPGDGQVARPPGLRLLVRDHRQPPRQRRRPRPEGRGADDVPDGQERRQGPQLRDQANLRNLSGEGLLLHDGRFDISNMMPGETRRVAFTFDVEPSLADPEARSQLSIRDDDLREERGREGSHSGRRCRSPIAASGGAQRRARAAAPTSSTSRTPAGRVFARLPAGAARRGARDGQRVHEALAGRRRFAFAQAADSKPAERRPAARVRGRDGARAARARNPAAAARHARRAHRGPRRPRATTRACSTRTSSSARARSSTGPTATAPIRSRWTSTRTCRFARASTSSRSSPARTRTRPTQRTFIVRRDGPGGELLQTPKTEDELSETSDDE